MLTVRDSLRDKVILLTGSTGFLARVFLERLFWEIPEVKKVYLVVRASDAAKGVERVESEIFAAPLFGRLKEKYGAGFQNFLSSKICVVAGDISCARLGLRETDYLDIIGSVDFIINAAASTDFTMRIDHAVQTNSLSALHIRTLVEDSRHAKLLHVSTCYVQECLDGIAKEKPATQVPAASRKLPALPGGQPDVKKILDEIDQLVSLKMAGHKNAHEGMDDVLSVAGMKFSKARGWFNSYTFTKWLGEQILLQSEAPLHCTILRPSIIESCLKEPLRGWIQGLKVADPLIYGVGIDKVKLFPGTDSTVLDLIPADLVVNSMLIALAELSSQSKPTVRIYQVCSGSENPLTIGNIQKIVRRAFPIPRFIQRVMIAPPLFFAAIQTAQLMVKGLSKIAKLLQKQRWQTKLNRSLGQFRRLEVMADIYGPYTNLTCVYSNEELLKLFARLPSHDQQSFPISAASFEWDHYMHQIHIPGLVQYVVQARPKKSIVAPRPVETATLKVAR